MAEHLNKFRELANLVESRSTSGKSMDINELLTLLSLSLPECSEPIIMALQLREEEVSFDTFHGRLMHESARRQVAQKGYEGEQQSSLAAAFTVRVPTRGRGGGRYDAGRGGMRAQHTSSFGRSENAVGFNKSARKPKGKGKCFYYQKDGHWKRDCYQKKSEELKKANQQSRGEKSGLAFTMAESTSTTQRRLDWIIDSGASQHLCDRKEMFLSATYKDIPHRGIEIADGSLIEAIGMRDIGIGSLVLSGVLFVPRVGGNLISVGRLIDARYDVSFGSTICIISKEQDCLKGRRQGNLYYLQDENKIEMAHLQPASNKPMPETVTVWHKMLGHRTLDQAAIHYLQPRVSDFKIKSDKEISGEQNLCETCACGRQHKEAITGSRDKANEPLEVVHTDICGPIQVSTINGERYFITFIDEKSGRIAVTLLKTKSEAMRAFQAYKARAEKEAEQEIKRLRSDSGGEYMGLQFKSYLRANEISHSVSPRYSPSHNGLAEWANGTLIESARCMLQEAGLDKAFWGFAVATAAHIHKRLPSRSHLDRSPLEY